MLWPHLNVQALEGASASGKRVKDDARALQNTPSTITGTAASRAHATHTERTNFITRHLQPHILAPSISTRAAPQAPGVFILFDKNIMPVSWDNFGAPVLPTVLYFTRYRSHSPAPFAFTWCARLGFVPACEVIRIQSWVSSQPESGTPKTNFEFRFSPPVPKSNETWVIVGSVAEPTITKFHLSCGEEPSSYWELHLHTSNGKRPRG